MPRGKPFVCWLSTEGHYRDVTLHIGDEVMFETMDDGWVRGKIGQHRGEGFAYFVKYGNKSETVYMINSLKPVEGFDYVDV